MITVNTTPDYPSQPTNALKPRFALVMHGDRQGHNLSVTRHDIEHGVIQRGSILRKDAVMEMLNDELSPTATGFGQQKTRNAITPANVLIDNAQHIVWHRPSQVDKLWFSSSAQGSIKSYDVKVPSMVFVVHKVTRQLSICATGTKSRPTLDTKIYLAPLQNYSSNGSFCLGAAKLPNDCSAQYLEQMEATVFDSQFTHFNCNKVLKTYPSGDYDAYYRILAEKEQTKKGFYVKEMMPISDAKTLGEWLSKQGI